MSGSKNCYSVKSGGWDENCYYGERVFNSKDAVDGVRIDDTSNCYDSYNIHDCYGIAFSNNVSDAKLSMYITDCKNVSDCIGCIWLENKNHYILNKPVTKEEFQSTWSNILSSSNYRQEFLKKYNELLTIFPRRALIIEWSEDAYGDEIFNSKNVWYGFGIRDVENTKYAYDEAGSRDTMDVNGDDLGELSYECSSNYAPRHTSFSFNNANVTDCYYVETSINLHNCFGCVGLHDKSYCILNKQYTKEEYEILVPKIIEKMIQDGEWGEFFPATMSPYGYNESEAMEYYPIDKEDVVKNWIFKWSDYIAPVPKVDKTIPGNKIPDDVSIIPDDVLNWAIECEVTKRPFRIIKQELEFYRKHWLPLPRRHPDQRHRDRMNLRHERNLYNRHCDKCQKVITTTYHPERPEKIFCEACYSKILNN